MRVTEGVRTKAFTAEQVQERGLLDIYVHLKPTRMVVVQLVRFGMGKLLSTALSLCLAAEVRATLREACVG